MPKIKSITIAEHIWKWSSCQRCPLHSTKKYYVFAKGSVPADILFLGEAPGDSENIIGQPFVGPAGHLLDRIVSDSVRGLYKCCYGNLLCCIPLDENMNKIEFPKEYVKACSTRLREFVDIVKPRLIVCVGRHAEELVPKVLGAQSITDATSSYFFCAITHPSGILQADITARGLLIQKATLVLYDAVEELIPF